MYPLGAALVARENVKEKWKRDITKYSTGKICQNAVKKILIEAVLKDCFEEKYNQWKGFYDVLGYKLIQNLMEQYVKVTKSIKQRRKYELTED